jgi:hypothetical protein
MSEILVFHIDINDDTTIDDLIELKEAFDYGDYEVTTNWEEQSVGIWRVLDDDAD